MLFPDRVARFAGGFGEVEHHRIGRPVRMTVLADADREIEPGLGVPASGSRDSADSKLLERRPIPDQHVGIDQRDFDGERQGLLLGGGEFRTEVGNGGVPAGQDHRPAGDGRGLAPG